MDISRVSEKRRDSEKVKRLIQSIARNISTEASFRSLAADVRGGTDSFKAETAADYVTALEQLMIVDNLPAWNVHILSSATLRSTAKWHFADPSIACAALGLSAGKLAERISTNKTPAPSALGVLTGNGFSHRCPDGGLSSHSRHSARSSC